MTYRSSESVNWYDLCAFVSDISLAVFVLKRDVKLQLTNLCA